MNENMTVKRLPIGINFRDAYKDVFFAVCIILIIIAGGFIGSHAVGAICGGILGLAVQWWMTMISVVQIFGRCAFLEVEQIIEHAGYISVADGVYRHRFPRFLRFDSQIIRVSRNDLGASVIGPYYMLRHMNRLLNT